MLITAALLGIGDGVLNTQLSALIALLFKHDTVYLIYLVKQIVASSILFIVILVISSSLEKLVSWLESNREVLICVQEGAFAQLKVWQSASIAVVFFLSPYISLQAMVFIILAAIIISVAAFMFLILHVEKVFSKPTTPNP